MMRSESSNYKLGRLDKVLVWKFVLKPISQPRYRVQDGSWPNHKNPMISSVLCPSKPKTNSVKYLFGMVTRIKARNAANWNTAAQQNVVETNFISFTELKRVRGLIQLVTKHCIVTLKLFVSENRIE